MSDMLKRVRQFEGFTVQDIANKAKISRNTVINAEQGKAIRIEFANKIVKALNELSGKEYSLESLEIQIAN